MDLAKEISGNITRRLDKGASLQSELLLAQLEEQRAQLTLDQARQDVIAMETNLASLWKAEPTGITVSYETEAELLHLVSRISLLSERIDSTRTTIQLQNERDILKAEKAMAIAEARPAITLSSGVSRSQADKSKSFFLGVSLHLPFLNKNQGTRQNLSARLQALEYNIEQSQIEASANFRLHAIQLNKLMDGHATLDSILLPTAEKAYRTLQNAYDAGRVPYTQLLEARRALNDLSFEHNDILLSIREQIITLESLTGVALLVEKEI